MNKRMAENYLRDSETILGEARAARRMRLHHRTVRLCQESFELSVKGILRSIGIEYPKEHEISDLLTVNASRFPAWFQPKIKILESGSIWLSERRGVSMYGDELAGKPASQLFKSKDSRKAMHFADEALRSGRRLMRQIFGRSR